MQRQQLIDLALKLTCGGRTRVKCCRGDASMLVSHSIQCVSWYCFRCKDAGYEPHGVQSIEEIHRRTKEYRESLREAPGLVLPDDYTTEVPAHAAVWYLSKGISYELALQHQIGFTPALDRVVIPVWEDTWREDIAGEQLVNVQLRAWQDGIKPKYITPGGYKFPHAMFWNLQSAGDAVVITEDVLSAIKVGRDYPATSTLGTNLSSPRAWKVSQRFKEAYLWYDGDKPGRTAAKAGIAQLELMGVKAYNIHTDKDPKAYNRQQVHEIIRATKENHNG